MRDTDTLPFYAEDLHVDLDLFELMLDLDPGMVVATAGGTTRFTSR